MRLLSNTKIATKILFVVMALSMVTLIVAWISSRALIAADTEYSDLIANESRAALLLARLSRNANQMGYAAYRNIVYDGDTSAAKESVKAARASYEQSIALLAEIKPLLPNRTADIETYTAEIERSIRSSKRL